MSDFDIEAAGVFQIFTGSGTGTGFLVDSKHLLTNCHVVEPYRKVADSYSGTPWAEEALLAAGNHFQKDALDDKALPWYRRLVDEYPAGSNVEGATMRTLAPRVLRTLMLERATRECRISPTMATLRPVKSFL